MKKISVIIPVYNAQNFITETLESLVKQTYSNWECIIIDDGSTDNSKKIIKSFTSQDSRFKYYYQDNSGPSTARNYGKQIADGEIFQFLDSDDIIDHNLFLTVIEEYEKTNKNELLYFNMYIGKQDNILQVNKPNRKAYLDHNLTLSSLYYNFGSNITFIPACVFFTKKSLNNIKWDSGIKHSEDWDFFLKVLSNGYQFKNINSYLIYYRDREGSLSKNFYFTIRSNYYILNRWKGINYTFYVYRMADLYLKSIKMYFRKGYKIQFPFKYNKKNKLLFTLLIYPILIIKIIKLILRKLLK